MKRHRLIHRINQSRFPGVFYISLSSVLTSLSFSPWKLWPIGFLCVIPVFYYIENTEFKKRAVAKIIGLGFLQGVLISLFAYHWVIHTMEVFGNLPTPIASMIFLLYALGTNLRWVIFFLLLYWLKRRRQSDETSENFITRLISHPYLFCTGAWGISEYLGWQLFPYYGANLVSGNLIFIQIVDLIGVYGASLIWVLVNYAFYQALMQKKIPVAALVTLLICHIYGGIAYFYWSSQKKNYRTVEIGVVQGNTPLRTERGRSLSDYANSALNQMTLKSFEIMRKAKAQNKTLDMLVWPEGSIPYIGYHSFGNFRERLSSLQENHEIELFISDLLVYQFPSERRVYNNAFLLGKEGHILENYQKVVLLPFGEFLPLGDLFPGYRRAFSEVSNFNRGNKFLLFPSEIGKLMPLICYEVILPDFVLDFYRNTRKKAQLIVNITNDSWFGDSIESGQHLELARLRAIELRIPLVRGVNGGISTHFDITGRSFGETELFTAATPIYTVAIPPQDTTTPYVLFGSHLYYVFIFFFSAGFIYCAMVNRFFARSLYRKRPNIPEP